MDMEWSVLFHKPSMVSLVQFLYGQGCLGNTSAWNTGWEIPVKKPIWEIRDRPVNIGKGILLKYPTILILIPYPSLNPNPNPNPNPSP